MQTLLHTSLLVSLNQIKKEQMDMSALLYTFLSSGGEAFTWKSQL